MESYLHPSSEDIRLATAPRRSPQITEGLASPTSVYPQMQQMDSMISQPDDGMRTTDFFDYSSDDELAKAATAREIAANDSLVATHKMAQKKRQSNLPGEPVVLKCERRVSGPVQADNEGYQPLIGSAAHEDDNRVVETPSSSLVGSVDELFPGGGSSPPQFPKRLQKASMRTSSQLESVGDRASRIDQTLGAYAIAHEITLNALMRDESGLDRSLTQLQSGDRRSLLPTSLHRQDASSARARPLSSPPENKKVQVVPPPIDTSAPRRSLPEDIVRTPYPLSPETVHQKDANREKSLANAEKATSSIESVLTVRIHQNNPNSRRRVTQLTIPASNDFSIVRSHSPRSKEQHFKALDFDDAVLFQNLRKCYHELMGPMRVLSARSLQRISVTGLAMQEVDRGYWIHPPRSPQGPLHKRLSGTFSEERIMQYFRNPTLGKSRYAFVHWAHRLAAAPPVRTPRVGEDSEHSIDRYEQTESLEFVVCWSAARISVAFFVVLAMSVAASLLWIFLGHVTVTSKDTHGGYRDAGDRVTSGVIMGICLLLLGLSSIAGWLGLSWLVI